jgi:hypothetical protein
LSSFGDGDEQARGEHDRLLCHEKCLKHSTRVNGQLDPENQISNQQPVSQMDAKPFISGL